MCAEDEGELNRVKQSDEKGLLKKVTFNLISEVSEGICNVKSQGSRKRAFHEEATIPTQVPRQGTFREPRKASVAGAQ